VKNEKRRPSFVRPGALVWYEAREGLKFAAVVEDEPRELEGELVVKLSGLGDDYRTFTESERCTVTAAAVWSLSPREKDPSAAVVAKGGEIDHTDIDGQS
jgi:hypothetical protein